MSQTQQQPTIAITPGLARSLLMYLTNGGDRLTGDLLAEQLQIQANAPQAAAEQQAAFDAAVEAEVKALAKAADDGGAGSIMTTDPQNTRIGTKVKATPQPPSESSK